MSNAPFAPAANATYIIGHRNPDADAICSAIAYAAYKEARGEKGHVAARCGNSNARIDTILGRFRQPLPVYLSDVSPRRSSSSTVTTSPSFPSPIPRGASSARFPSPTWAASSSRGSPSPG